MLQHQSSTHLYNVKRRMVMVMVIWKSCNGYVKFSSFMLSNDKLCNDKLGRICEFCIWLVNNNSQMHMWCSE